MWGALEKGLDFQRGLSGCSRLTPEGTRSGQEEQMWRKEMVRSSGLLLLPQPRG